MTKVQMYLTNKVCLANKYEKMVNAIIPSPPGPFSDQPIPTPKMKLKVCQEGQLMQYDHIVLALVDSQRRARTSRWHWDSSLKQQFSIPVLATCHPHVVHVSLI